MSACDTKLRGPRNADLQRTFVLSSMGVPFDLTGWEVSFSVYPTAGAGSILALTEEADENGSSVSISSPAQGVISLLVTEADIGGLPIGSPPTSPASLLYDLVLESPEAVRTRILFGGFIIDPAGAGSYCDDDDQFDVQIGVSDIQLQIAGSLVTVVLPTPTPPYDPTDVGYDGYLLWGQSNEVGNGATLDPNIDTPDPRIFQFPVGGGSFSGQIIPANDPLIFPGGGQQTGEIGHAMAFARTRLATTPPNRSICLIQTAANGSSFGAGNWVAELAASETVVQATSNGVSGDTFRIVSGATTTTITIVPSGATGPQINAGTSPQTMAQNLANYINTNTVALGLHAGSVVPSTIFAGFYQFTLTANTAGSAGNSIVCSRTVGTTWLVGAASTANMGCGADAGGGPLFKQSVAAAGAFLALNPKNRIVGILGQQGEAESTTAASRYQTELLNLIAGFRSQIAGMSQVPFVMNGMVPEFVADSAQIQPIDAVHEHLPATLTFSGFSPGPLGSIPFQGFHYDAPSQRISGARMSLAFDRAKGNALFGVASRATNVEVSNIGPGSFTVSWEPPSTGNTRITGWSLQWRPTGSGVAWSTQSIDPTIFTGTITGLDAATSYDVQVVGSNEMGPGEPSEVKSVTTGPISYLVDQLFTTSAAILSLRKRLALFAGSCLNVRRDTDDMRLDVGFDENALLDVETLLAFCGSGSGYIHTWYDESGSAHDAVQDVEASQPRIVSAGVLVTQNGLPAIDFYSNGSTPVFLASASGFPVAADVTMTAVINEPTGAGIMHLIGPDSSGNHSFALNHQVAMYAGAPIAVSPASLPGGPNTYSIGVTYKASTQLADIYESGTSQATGTGTTPTAGVGFQIGDYHSLQTLQFVGLMQEAFIFGATLTSDQMATIASENRMAWDSV